MDDHRHGLVASNTWHLTLRDERLTRRDRRVGAATVPAVKTYRWTILTAAIGLALLLAVLIALFR